MATRDEIVRELETHVRYAARAVANEWPGVVEEDDVEQEIWLRLLDASPKYVEELHSLSKAAREKVLRDIGHQYALDERDDYNLFSGNYKYSGDDVRDYLRKGALHRPIDDAQSLQSAQFRGDDDENSSKSSSIGRETDLVVEWLDIRTAMQRLTRKNSEYAGALWRRYGPDPLIPEHNSAEKRRLHRAERALVREMNAAHREGIANHEGPGSRRAMSNSRATYEMSRSVG
jgi:hypothetical protein